MFMEKVLSVSQGDSKNLGDMAIALTIAHLLSSFGLKVDSYGLTRVSRIESSNSKQMNSSSRFRNFGRIMPVWILRIVWLLLKFGKIVSVSRNKYKYAFIGGGQLVLSNKYFSIAILLWSLLLKLYGTKVYMVFVGVGENFTLSEKLLYGAAFRIVDGLTVRDSHSAEVLLSQFGIAAEVIPDVAHLISTFCPNKDVQEYERDQLMVGIVDYAVYARYANEVSLQTISEESYISEWKKLVLTQSQGCRSVLLFSSASEDLVISRKLYFALSEVDSTFKLEYLDTLPSLDSMLVLFQKSKKVASGRMHSLILAKSYGCELIPWIISRKLLSYQIECGSNTTSEIQKEILSKFCRRFEFLLGSEIK